MRGIYAVLACAALLTACAPGPSDQTSTPDAAPTSQSTKPVPEPSSTSPTPSPSPEEPPPPPRTVTLNVSGDLLWHNSLWSSAELDGEDGAMGFYPQLAGLSDFVSRADIGVCHSEVPFAPEGGPFQNYPQFAAPPAIAPALA